jgi:cyclopropane fatty-acyl-phospholipid synthase-like methyltransferase
MYNSNKLCKIVNKVPPPFGLRGGIKTTDMLRFIGKQFRKPTGFLGKIVSWIMIRGNSPVYDKIIPQLDIAANDKILEIGYGHGIGIDKIASGCDCALTGIDFSELMFREASERNKKHIDQKIVELYLGDFLTFDMGSNKFDKIFCINVIYFWDKLDEPFKKVRQALKDGGLFCIFMVHQDYLEKTKFAKNDVFNKYSIEQVVECLKRSGFQDVGFKSDKGYFIKCRK